MKHYLLRRLYKEGLIRGEKFTFQNPLRLINGGKFVPAEPVK